MKALLNASNLTTGGALQAAASFVSEAVGDRGGDIHWHFAVSPRLADELAALGISIDPARRTVLPESPARSAAARRSLVDLARGAKADAVFTFFGPAYAVFDRPHLCGVADGWVTHSSRLAFQHLGLSRELLVFPPLLAYKGYWYTRADRWVVEADVAKQGLVRRLRLAPEHIDVVPNSCAERYLRASPRSSAPEPGRRIRILYLSSYYPHKNLELIPDCAAELARRRPGLDFEFVITLASGDRGTRRVLERAERLGVGQHVENVGPVPLVNGPALYESCHICFVPSVLETFSANYPEAMAMRRPIVTSDLGFAHDVCKDAALYFAPNDAAAAAAAIVSLLESAERWRDLVERGIRVLAGLPTPAQRYRLYCAALERCAAQIRL